ncbi:MAG: DUF3352 domain-containing protein [Actinomycetota bacterium]
MDETGSGPDQTGENPPVPVDPHSGGSTEATLIESATPRVGRARYVALALAVFVLLAGGAAVIVARGGSAAAVEFKVPADVVAFVKVSIRPSLEQQQVLARLLSRVGSSGREKLQSRIDALLDDALSGTGVGYSKDVRPWIGSQIGIAVRAPESAGSDPVVVALVAVDDEGAARAALAKFTEKPFSYEISGGIAYLSDSAKAITELRAGAEKGPVLADAEAYRSARESVDGDGLVLMWADNSRLKDIVKGEGLSTGVLDSFASGRSGIVVAAVRAEAAGIALVGHAFAGTEQEEAPTKGTPALLESTSSGLVASLTAFNLGARILVGLEATGKAGAGASPVESAVEAVRESLGIDLERDLAPMLRGEFSVVFGGLSGSGVPDVGVLIEPTDTAAATRVLAALRARVEGFMEGLGGGGSVRDIAGGFIVEAGDFSVVLRRGKDRIVIASSEPYATTLQGASASSLRDDAVYKRAFDESDDGVVMQMFVRVDRLRTLLETFLGPEQRPAYEADVAPLLEHMESFGLRVRGTGDEVDFRALLSVTGS